MSATKFIADARAERGFLLVIGMMITVQVTSLAIFYSRLFTTKVAAQLPVGTSPSAVIALSLLLGVLVGVVIESGSFFFAMNGMRRASAASAFFAGLLAMSSWYDFITPTTPQGWFQLVGVLVMAFFPPSFIYLASHRLADKLREQEVVQMQADTQAMALLQAHEQLQQMQEQAAGLQEEITRKNKQLAAYASVEARRAKKTQSHEDL